MSALRLKILTLNAVERFVTEDCIHCGALFAMTETTYDRRQADKKSFWCPACGKSMAYQGKSETQLLKDAQARETALRDQLDASVRDADAARQALLRDRHRFANGVCPCCTRSFENVRRHMASQHPDYDPSELTKKTPTFECSCGRAFDTLRGLRVHQGHVRPDNWVKLGAKSDYWSRRSAHLTVAASR